MPRRTAVALFLPVFLGLSVGSSGIAHATLVTNGGFEQAATPAAPIPGWTIGGTGVSLDSTFPNTGQYDAAFGAPTPGTLSQTIATTPGQSYVLSFALLDESGSPTDVFTASFGGQTTTITGDAAAFVYTPETITIPSASVTGVATLLSFSGANDTADWNLDDVSLTPIAVPEPPIDVMFGLAAIAGVILAARRSRST